MSIRNSTTGYFTEKEKKLKLFSMFRKFFELIALNSLQ